MEGTMEGRRDERVLRVTKWQGDCH